jgi:type IV pilus assembly protein PilV
MSAEERHMKRNPISRQAARGATMLELLISVLVLGIGLLGVAAGQSVSLRNSQSAMQRSQAVVMSYAILDAMRSNAVAAASGAYQFSPGAGCAAPSGAGRAQADLANWVADLKRVVSEDACGEVSCSAGICMVAVRWDDTRASGGSAEQRLVSRSRL